jgi:hypothetical protein
MFVEKLVKQHRVHCFMANGVGLAEVIGCDQVWVVFLLTQPRGRSANAIGI